ncbi:MAG: hypothetical protein IPM20_06120 [Gammaproteobacteria bacterium]|nr:hypothetical protein [Gammaproteobacteria bacterium]
MGILDLDDRLDRRMDQDAEAVLAVKYRGHGEHEFMRGRSGSFYRAGGCNLPALGWFFACLPLVAMSNSTIDVLSELLKQSDDRFKRLSADVSTRENNLNSEWLFFFWPPLFDEIF